MATPSKKSSDMEKSLTALTGQDRREVIRPSECIAPPFGCGGEAWTFRDNLSAMEYVISGLCQECQDQVFGDEGH